jgi:hypothetical protein
MQTCATNNLIPKEKDICPGSCIHRAIVKEVKFCSKDKEFLKSGGLSQDLDFLYLKTENCKTR